MRTISHYLVLGYDAARLCQTCVIPVFEGLADATQAFVDKILSKPPLAISMTKHMVTAASNTWTNEASYADAYLLLMSGRTGDAVEASMARMQKRDPKFKGR